MRRVAIQPVFNGLLIVIMVFGFLTLPKDGLGRNDVDC